MFRITRCVKCVVRSLHQSRKFSTETKTSSRPSIPSLIFGKYLLHTNIISSGFLMWFGDICQQEIEFRQGKMKKRYDYARMARMFVVGLGLGPIHHYYYIYIARIMPKRDLSTVLTKIGLDQFVMSPLCIAGFFYTMGTLEMKPLDKMNEELKNKFLEVYVMDWCVWVPTQFINFYFVPVKYQVFYINSITMLYNIFLSYIKHRDVDYLHQQEIEHPLVIVQAASDAKKIS